MARNNIFLEVPLHLYKTICDLVWLKKHFILCKLMEADCNDLTAFVLYFRQRVNRSLQASYIFICGYLLLHESLCVVFLSSIKNIYEEIAHSSK